jgi:hypothetical protein
MAETLQTKYRNKLDSEMKKLGRLIKSNEKRSKDKAELMPEADANRYICTGIVSTFKDMYNHGGIQSQIDVILKAMEESELDSSDKLEISSAVFERTLNEIESSRTKLLQRLSRPDITPKKEREIQVEMVFIGWHQSIIRDGLIPRLREICADQ